MEIANIVTDNKINVGEEFNIVNSIEEIVYTNLPTLIVGYEKVISILSKDKINILNKQIDENTFWTLDKNIKRYIYTVDLEDFIRFSYKKYIERISFIDVDFIQFSEKKMKKVKNKLFLLKDTIIYKSDNNVVYIYGENIIFSIDLNLSEYMGLNSEKILNKLFKNCTAFLEGSDILIDYNNHLERLNYEIKYIPVLYSINPNDEKITNSNLY